MRSHANRRKTAAGLTVLGVGAALAVVGVAPASATTHWHKVGSEAELRAAVAKANQTSARDTIVLTSSISFTTGGAAGTDEDGPETGDLDVTGRLTVQGRGHTIDASGVDRIFDVPAGSALTLRHVTLTGGAPAAGTNGGAVRSQGWVEAVGTRAVHNAVTGDLASGGAFMNDGGTLRVIGSRVAYNSAVRAGGAIEASAGLTLVKDSRLDHNSAGAGPGNGGAVHLTGEGKVNVKDSRVVHNTASSEGGGLWNSSTGRLLVSGSFVAYNDAAGVGADNGGGGIFNDGGTAKVVRTVVADNTASGTSGSGGGFFNNAGTLRLHRTEVLGNSALRAGGGIEALGGDTRLHLSALTKNEAGAAPGNGGGLHLTGEGYVRLQRSNVVGNIASSEGGGLWNSSTGTMAVERSTVRGNSALGDAADNGGGGLFNDGGSLRVTGSLVAGNHATGLSGSGGGIFNNAGSLVVVKSAVNANDAQRAGGGIESLAGDVKLRAVGLRKNSTGPNPGNGGGLHLTGAATASYVGGATVGNTATNEGGGLWNSSTGTLVVSNVRISGNTAPTGPDTYNQPPGGIFTVDGEAIPVG